MQKAFGETGSCWGSGDDNFILLMTKFVLFIKYQAKESIITQFALIYIFFP